MLSIFNCKKIGSANQDSNPGLLGEKRERYLCAMPPPLYGGMINIHQYWTSYKGPSHVGGMVRNYRSMSGLLSIALMQG